MNCTGPDKKYLFYFSHVNGVYFKLMQEAGTRLVLVFGMFRRKWLGVDQIVPLQYDGGRNQLLAHHDHAPTPIELAHAIPLTND